MRVIALLLYEEIILGFPLTSFNVLFPLFPVNRFFAFFRFFYVALTILLLNVGCLNTENVGASGAYSTALPRATS